MITEFGICVVVEGFGGSYLLLICSRNFFFYLYLVCSCLNYIYLLRKKSISESINCVLIFLCSRSNWFFFFFWWWQSKRDNVVLLMLIWYIWIWKISNKQKHLWSQLWRRKKEMKVKKTKKNKKINSKKT